MKQQITRQDVIKLLDNTASYKPSCMFKVGEIVQYKNSYGVIFKDFLITKIERRAESTHWYVKAYFLDTEWIIYGGEAYWMPHKVEEFKKLNNEFKNGVDYPYCNSKTHI